MREGDNPFSQKRFATAITFLIKKIVYFSSILIIIYIYIHIYGKKCSNNNIIVIILIFGKYLILEAIYNKNSQQFRLVFVLQTNTL